VPRTSRLSPREGALEAWACPKGRRRRRIISWTAQKGVSVSFKGLGLDDTSDPLGITAGDLSYRVLGQSGRAELP
jgi:hypothetical protein